MGTNWAESEATEEKIGSCGEVLLDEEDDEDDVAFLFGETIFSIISVRVRLCESSSSLMLFPSSSSLSEISPSSSAATVFLEVFSLADAAVAAAGVTIDVSDRSSLFRLILAG